MDKKENISLESIIKKLSRIEWLEDYFSIEQRKEVFGELKEEEEIYNKIHQFEKEAFYLDKEEIFARIKLVIVKSVEKYIESKYSINLQLRYPDHKTQKSFKKIKPLPIPILLAECRKIVNQ